MALKKKRNPLLIDLPPVEPEANGGGEEWEQVEGLPDELQPSEFFAVMSQDFSYELYMAQLKDWWMMRLANVEDPGDRKTVLKQAAAMIEDAQNLINLGFPVEGLPEYTVVRRAVGNNVSMAYQSFAQNYMEEQQLMEEQRTAVREQLLGTLDKRYGGKMGAAIRAGLITEQEVEDQRRQAMREGLPTGNARMGDTRARQMVGSAQGRARLQEGVAEGITTSEEAWGAGTPWESWQREQATAANRGAGQADSGFINVLQQAKALGIDTSNEERALVPGMPQETQALIATGLYERVKAVKQKQQEDYAGYLTRDYADIYKSWQEKNVGQPTAPVNFLSWIGENEEGVENAEWQKAYTAKEAQRWGEYGDIYPAYRRYAKKNYAEAKPFEEWQTIDPQAVAWMTDYKKRKALEEQQARKRIAPAGLLR